MTPRRLGAALALLAAVAILVGTFTMRWLTAPSDEGGVGLSGVEACRGGECKTMDWDDLTKGARVDDELKMLKTASMVALIGSVLAAALLLAIGISGVATDRSMSLITIFSIIGSVLALAGAIATVVLMREYFKGAKMDVGYSAMVYAGGCVVGVVGSIISRGGRGYATRR
jgi:hypothetical protein